MCQPEASISPVRLVILRCDMPALADCNILFLVLLDLGGINHLCKTKSELPRRKQPSASAQSRTLSSSVGLCCFPDRGRSLDKLVMPLVRNLCRPSSS